jgi:hypothetical protein
MSQAVLTTPRKTTRSFSMTSLAADRRISRPSIGSPSRRGPRVTRSASRQEAGEDGDHQRPAYHGRIIGRRTLRALPPGGARLVVISHEYHMKKSLSIVESDCGGRWTQSGRQQLRPTWYSSCPSVHRSRNQEHADTHCTQPQRPRKIGRGIGRTPATVCHTNDAMIPAIGVLLSPSPACGPRHPLLLGSVRVRV